MRRWLGWIAIAWLLAVCAVALVAYGSSTAPQSLDSRTLAVASGLRCPVCQGESVADSPSDIARSIRVYIRQSLARGESPAQITRFLLQRYPDISLAPATSGIGSVAWIAPPLLVLGGIGLLITLVMDWRGRGRQGSRPVEAEYVERVRRELGHEAYE